MTAAPERVRSREQMRNGLKLIKFAKGSTMLDDAPWEWGSTGGWCNGMPDFFQVHASAQRAVGLLLLLLRADCPRDRLWPGSLVEQLVK